MIDIAAIHRKSGSKKILGKFFETAAYKHTHAYLTDIGIEEKGIVDRRHAYRGAVGISYVHPMVALEYFRWADFKKYASWILLRMNPEAENGEKAEILE